MWTFQLWICKSFQCSGVSSRLTSGMSCLTFCPVYMSAALRGVKQAATRDVFSFMLSCLYIGSPQGCQAGSHQGGFFLSCSPVYISAAFFFSSLLYYFSSFSYGRYVYYFHDMSVSWRFYSETGEHCKFSSDTSKICLIFLKHYSTFYNNVNIKYFLFIYKSPSLRDRIVKKMFYIF